MSEKLLPPAFSEDRECFGLQGDRDLARRFVTLLAPFQQRDAMGPLVPLMRLAFHQSRLFHALQQRGHGVGIAAHALRQFPLCQPARLAFQQRAHHGELIRRDLQVRNAAAKRLVQAEPGPAQQRGQATALGRIDGHPAVYFNTGTWRAVHQIGHDLGGRPSFLPYDAMSYLVFFPSDDKLNREYEWWTGAMVTRDAH